MLKPMMENLVAFLDHNANSLETVRLLQCHMGQGDTSNPDTWKPIVTKLRAMPKLVFLELQQLKSDADRRNHLDEEASGTADVVVYWGWRREQVQAALEKLEETHQTVEIQGYTYLNLHAGT
jgi:hypothetical protein